MATLTNRRLPWFFDARAGRPGVPICIAWLLAVGLLLAACTPRQPETPAERRVWEGPTQSVASSGVVRYERREIAQQITVPACLSVGPNSYRFTRVEPFAGGGTNPPGLNDSFHRLDRWRLWTPPGPLESQSTLYVTIRGSTGILAVYERLPSGGSCDPGD